MLEEEQGSLNDERPRTDFSPNNGAKTSWWRQNVKILMIIVGTTAVAIIIGIVLIYFMINSGEDESIINPTTSKGSTVIPGEGTTSIPDKVTTTPFPDERELSWNEKYPQLWPTECGRGTLKPEKTKSKRIVNGGEAPPKSIPWQVDIEVIDWRGKDENGNEITSSVPHCGGTIINNDLILTAAHCFKNVKQKDLFVIANQHNTLIETGNETRADITKVWICEGFNKDTLHHDVAIMRIEPALVDFVPFGAAAQKAKIIFSLTMEYNQRAFPIHTIGFGSNQI